MTKIYITLAAVSALGVAPPLAAQKAWNGDNWSRTELQERFDTGVESGAISSREAMPLREQMRRLALLERQYSRAGLTRQERDHLRERSQTLGMYIAAAEQAEGGRMDEGAMNAGTTRGGKDLGGMSADRDDMGQQGMDDGPDARDNRLAGDVRIGDRFSGRYSALPAMYRARYRDSAAVYFSRDDNRIYQIDRASGMVQAIHHIGG